MCIDAARPPAGFTFATPIKKNALHSDITMRSEDGHIELWTWLWGMGAGLPQLSGANLPPTFTMSAILNLARPDEQNPMSAVQTFIEANRELLATTRADEAVFGVFEPGPRAVDGRCCAILVAWHKRGVGVIFAVAFMDIDDEAVSERAFAALGVLRFR